MFEGAAGLFGIAQCRGDLPERAAVVLLHGALGLALFVVKGLHVPHGDTELVLGVVVVLLRRWGDGMGARGVGAAPLLGLCRGRDGGMGRSCDCMAIVNDSLTKAVSTHQYSDKRVTHYNEECVKCPKIPRIHFWSFFIS